MLLRHRVEIALLVLLGAMIFFTFSPEDETYFWQRWVRCCCRCCCWNDDEDENDDAVIGSLVLAVIDVVMDVAGCGCDLHVLHLPDGHHVLRREQLHVRPGPRGAPLLRCC